MKNPFIKTVAFAAVASFLVACGGGTDKPSASIAPGASQNAGSTSVITMTSGDAIQVPGQMNAPHNLLTSMVWTSQADSPASPALVLSNDKCDLATKNDTKMPSISSTWSCKLGVISPAGMTADATYTLTLTGKVDNGNTLIAEQKVTVLKAPPVSPSPNPNPAPAPKPASAVANAGPGFKVTSGQAAPFNCSGPTGAIFQWLIVDNGNFPLSLSSYNSANTGFTAPAVAADTPITLQCLATDAAGATTTSNVTATVVPISAPALPINTLVASITAPANARPGDTVSFSAVGKWFDQAGNATTGPVPTYSWSFVNTSGLSGFNLFSTSGESNNLFVPSTISTATVVPVKVVATSGTLTSEAIVNILVDANPTITPAVNPAAVSCSLSDVTKLCPAVITIDGTSGSNLFYKWTHISGPLMTLGGDNTAKMGFATPSVAAKTEMIFRVAMSYYPITASNTGVYYINSVVTITP
jgi:hypothetical protein